MHTPERVFQIDASRRSPDPRSAAQWLGSATSPAGETLGANDRFFTRDGKPWLPLMGEIHYTRVGPGLWEDALLKMKACGIEIVASYVIWIHHEEEDGRIHWTGCYDLRRFVELCAQHGLRFWARIGPWAHAEVRNGGLPDWLFAKGRVRSMDPGFLSEVERLYGEIGGQLRGLLHKDGGPVIGVQLENELFFGDREAVDYMRELKRLALEAGLDVPFYSATAWHGFHDDVADLMPVMAAYPDAPWDASLERVYQNSFVFSHDLEDPSVGADLVPAGSSETVPRARIKRFPFASAELGGGMQVTWHRRVAVSARDLITPAIACLGSGANLLGYYMFHGGLNPHSRYAPLQESRDTFYPNDLPLMDYDFQAPIAADGTLRESASRFRLLHGFLSDFGETLAPMTTYFPEMLPAGPDDRDTLRWVVRTDGKSGFLFLINYQRYLNLGEKSGLRFRVALSEGVAAFPDTPVDLPDGATVIWPFNLNLEGARLRYATVQPFGRLRVADEEVFLFAATDGVRAELVFDRPTVRSFEADGAGADRDEETLRWIVESPDWSARITLETASGMRIRIVVLSETDARLCWRVSHDRERLLVQSPATVLPAEGGFTVESIGEHSTRLTIFPPRQLQARGARLEADNADRRYTLSWPKREATVSATEIPSGGEEEAALQQVLPQPLKGLKAVQPPAGPPGEPGHLIARLRTVGATDRNAARFVFISEDSVDLWVNGRFAGRGGHPERLTAFSIGHLLQGDDNVIDVRIRRNRGSAGILAGVLSIGESEQAPRVEALEWSAGTDKAADGHSVSQEPIGPVTEFPGLSDEIGWRDRLEQPGPLYGPVLEPVPGARAWCLHGLADTLEGVVDWILSIRYSGDTAALYADRHLVADDFQRGAPMRVSLVRNHLIGFEGEVILQIKPLREHHRLFMENEALRRAAQSANLDSVELIPVYREEISVQDR